jgi:mevalonate pyrophosphate decarboxylase
MKNRDKRTDQLVRLLDETKEKVANHRSGKELLEDADVATFEKRVDLYERKLERMKQPLDEKEIERMVQREEMRAERYHREL